MLIPGQSTEERIAEIAGRFGQGFQNFQQGQDRLRTQDLQAEALKRQRALRALEASNNIAATTGRFVDPGQIAPMLSAGNLDGLGEVLRSAPLTRKAEIEAQERQAAREDRNINRRLKEKKLEEFDNKPNIVNQTRDKKYAEELVRWETGGGAKQFENLQNLDTALNTLKTQPGITGARAGMVPDAVRRFTNPTAVATRQQVESAVQGSLRETLGSQFTEKEGERIMRNAFDPGLPQEENFRRVSVIRAGLMASIEAKNAQFEYLKKNGTMAGYNGPTPEDVFKSIIGQQAPELIGDRPAGGSPEPGTVEDGYEYLGGDPANPSSWKKV